MYLFFLINNGPIWDSLEFDRQSKDRIVGESTKVIDGNPFLGSMSRAVEVEVIGIRLMPQAPREGMMVPKSNRHLAHI